MTRSYRPSAFLTAATDPRRLAFSSLRPKKPKRIPPRPPTATRAPAAWQTNSTRLLLLFLSLILIAKCYTFTVLQLLKFVLLVYYQQIFDDLPF